MAKNKKTFTHDPFFKYLVWLLIGIGLGVLMTYPIIGEHPVRWGGGILSLGLLGYLYPLAKK